MGNRLFKQRTEQQPDAIVVKEADTLSIISDPENLLEPKVVIEENTVSACATVSANACAIETASEIVTVDIPIIATSDISESLSKSLPIDIPIPEPVIDQKSDLAETLSENNIIENNNSEEIASLSSISEECGFKSEPITEESDLGSDEDVLELDE